jgi:large subunit ribosomal protein L21
MYAVIKAGGKQQKVKPGDVIEIDHVSNPDGDSVTFTPLLVVDDEGRTHVGKDLGKAVVRAKLLGEQKGDKVRVFKYRPKTGYSRRQGHRQLYTLIEIEDVSLSGTSSARPPRPARRPRRQEVEGAADAAETPEAAAETPEAAVAEDAVAEAEDAVETSAEASSPAAAVTEEATAAEAAAEEEGSGGEA